MGFGAWIITLPNYHAWMVSLQLVSAGLICAAATLWVKTLQGALIASGLLLLSVSCLMDWGVYYLHVPGLLLFTTAGLDMVSAPRLPGSSPAGRHPESEGDTGGALHTPSMSSP
jgi:hypothetical protein